MIQTGANGSSAPLPSGEPMIRLERITKRYPGQDRPAVAELSLDVPKGETVVFVGPSGCGKTTTLKMINRVFEPTSGRIIIEGDDVTDVNPDRLRRRIGYVIQQIGLFPHMTIAANIAVVPKLLSWDKKRTADRVDELLELVGMEAARFRDRYPKELSGGQAQRVGVARALSADPPVMLMDEPFGATDPITRDHLQDEFLRLQEEVQKTIVFVTHDIDEAIKMGDRIAILRQDSMVAQYDTPERILSDPADEFVADFIGSGGSLKRLKLTLLDEVDAHPWPTVPDEASADDIADALRNTGGEAVLALDDRRRPVRWAKVDGVAPTLAQVSVDQTLQDALDAMLRANHTRVAIIDEQGGLRGTVDLDTIMGMVHRGAPGQAEVLTERGTAP